MLKRLHFGYDSGRKLLAMASGPQKLHLWRTGPDGDASESRDEPDLELSTDRSKIVGLHLQPGGLLVTVHEAGVAAAWSLDEADGQLSAALAWEASFEFRPAVVASSDVSGGRLAIAGKLGDLVVIEADDDAARLVTLEGHSSEITAVTFDETGDRLASGDRDHALYIWETAELDAEADAMQPAFELDGCESWPLSMQFSSDGRRLAAGAMDNGVYLWALSDDGGEMVGCVFEHHGWIVDVAWAPDDSIVAAASWDNTVGIYGRERLRPRFSFEYHRDYVSTLCFHDDNLYTGGYDHKVCRWRWRDAEFAGEVEAHGDWVLGMVELDASRMATLSSDHTVRIWKLPEFELVQTLGASVSSGFDLGASVDMSSFVDGANASREQLEDRRPPRAEMPPGRIDAVRKLDASGTSATAQTAFGMLESELGNSEFDADSSFEPNRDLDLAASDSITTEYDSEAELDAAVQEFTSDAADVELADDAQTSEAQIDQDQLDQDQLDQDQLDQDQPEDASTREVDPEEIDPGVFDLGGDIDEAPELEIDSEELAESADASPSDASLDIDLDVEASPSIELDAELGPTDPEALSLQVEDDAPRPEERAEEALAEEGAPETATEIDPESPPESHAEAHEEAPDEVDEELQLEPEAEEPPSDALGQLESSMDASGSADDDPALTIELDEAGEDDDTSNWVDVSADLDDAVAASEAPDSPDEDAKLDDGAPLEGSPDDDQSDAADAFVSADFGDDEDGERLGALSSGALSTGDQEESLDQELDQVSAGGVGLEDASSPAGQGMGDLLSDAPDDLGLGDISSSDLDVELGSGSVEAEQDVPGLDRMSFPDSLDVNPESLETHAELDEPGSATGSELPDGGTAPEPEADAVDRTPAEGRTREKRSPESGDADETDEDSEDADQGDAERPATDTEKTRKTPSLKAKLKAALGKKAKARPKPETADGAPETTAGPSEDDGVGGDEDVAESRPSDRRAKLEAALSKLGTRTKKKKNKNEERTPESSLPKPNTGGEDTPAAELGFDLGIGDDLADTLSKLMPQDAVDSEGDEPPAEVAEPEPPKTAAPGSEVEEDDAPADDKSLLIELVDVVEEPEEEDEIIGPDPNFQSGETLTSIRPMSLASEAEETPGLRMPDFGRTDEDTDEDDESEDSALDGPAVDEPVLRESGDEVTPAGDILVPEEAKKEEDPTKQVSPADLQFIRSGAGKLSPSVEEDREELAVPSLQSETETEHAAEPSQPSMIHSELADIWMGRSAGGVFGKGIIRPSPDEHAVFSETKALDTPHRWIYGVGRLIERGLLCVCGGDDTVSIFEESGTHISSLRVPEDGLNDIAVVALGSVVFAAGDDGYIYAWTLPNAALDKTESIERAAVAGHDGWVTSLDVDVDNQLLISGSFDSTARVWALDGSADPLVLEGHDGAISGVAMTERGPVTGGHDGTVRFWTETGLQIDQLDGYGKVLSVKSGSGIVVWTSALGDVHVRDSNGVRKLESHDTQATTVAVDERGGIASADKRGQIKLYAPGELEPFQTLQLDSAIWAMHLTESRLTAGTDAGRVRFFERE